MILDGHRAVEGHLADAGIASTLVRPSTFIDAIVRIASQFIPQDAWGGNDGGGTCTFIDTRDVAEVFAVLLTQGPEAHDGHVYTLTGPEAVTMPRVAELVSAAAGREVAHHQRTEAESESFLNGLGLPALQVAVLLGLDQFVREGTMSEVHDTTQALLGKPAPQRPTSARTLPCCSPLPSRAAPGPSGYAGHLVTDNRSDDRGAF